MAQTNQSIAGAECKTVIELTQGHPAALLPFAKHLIRVASVTGRLPEHGVMLLWLTHTTGIRVRAGLA